MKKVATIKLNIGCVEIHTDIPVMLVTQTRIEFEGGLFADSKTGETNIVTEVGKILLVKTTMQSLGKDVSKYGISASQIGMVVHNAGKIEITSSVKKIR